MKNWLVISFVLLVNAAYAQQNIKIPQTGKTIEEFVPEGYKVMAEADGDLNSDTLEDVVVVLSNARLEENTELNFDKVDVEFDTVKRPVIVLFRQRNGYKLAAKAMDLVRCKTCGGAFGDPYADIEIANKVISISHYGGSAWKWSDTRKYRYQNGDFYLIGKTDISFWAFGECGDLGDVGTYEDINLVTGAREYKKISEDCKIVADETNKIKKKPLVKMVDYKIDSN